MFFFSFVPCDFLLLIILNVLTMADLHNRDQVLLKSVLVINLEVKDNHEEAAVGARLALDLCEQVHAILCFGYSVMLDISLVACYA